MYNSEFVETAETETQSERESTYEIQITKIHYKL